MLKIDASLMFKPSKVGQMAAELENCGFDGAYTFEGQGDPFIGVAAAAMTGPQPPALPEVTLKTTVPLPGLLRPQFRSPNREPLIRATTTLTDHACARIGHIGNQPRKRIQQ